MKLKPGILFVSLIALIGTGCSKPYWAAQYYMLRAEEAMGKAYKLKEQKVSYEKRLQDYRTACRFFYKAYQQDREIFTLNRIRDAVDSCWRVGDSATESIFLEFERTYSKGHPTENEYGDPGFWGDIWDK